MIEKDLQPIYASMIKTTYAPIIRRTIAILLIHDMDRMQGATQTNDTQFFELIRSNDGRRSLCMCLDSIAKRRGDIIEEIIRQYGIHTNMEMVSFYHEHFEKHFNAQIEIIRNIVKRGRYDMLDRIARTQPE